MYGLQAKLQEAFLNTPTVISDLRLSGICETLQSQNKSWSECE